MAKDEAKARLVRPSRNGQITIPADFRRQLGIKHQSILQVTLEDGELRIKPVPPSGQPEGSPWFKNLYDLFAPVRQEAASISDEEINTAIDEAIARVRQRNA